MEIESLRKVRGIGDLRQMSLLPEAGGDAPRDLAGLPVAAGIDDQDAGHGTLLPGLRRRAARTRPAGLDGRSLSGRVGAEIRPRRRAQGLRMAVEPHAKLALPPICLRLCHLLVPCRAPN